MKRIIALILVLVISVCLFSACNTEKEPEPPKDPQEQQEVKDFGKIFYVAVDGSDENEGTKESPLATLGGAVAKVREYKAANGLPEGGIKVEFAAGTYKVTQQTDLTAEDSGECGKPIVYAAAEGAEVIFDGGLSLNPADFKPANDEFKALLQTEEAKAHVLEIDLRAAGIWDEDDAKSFSDDADRHVFYLNDKMQTVAKWPNEGYYTSELVDIENCVIGSNGEELGLIFIPQDRYDLWKTSEHLRFFGYPYYDWASSTVEDIALSPEQPALLYPVNLGYGLRPGCYFFIYNVAAELDRPGEYYWDVENGKLYYWPVDGFANAKLSFSQFKGKCINSNGASYVTVDGLTFENIRNIAVNGTETNYFSVTDSTFRCLTNYAVLLNGNNNRISGNTMYNLASGSVYVTGGDIPLQRPSNTVVTNNRIYSYAQIYTTYKAAVSTNGCGFTISHNEIYDAPHEAIAFNSGLTLIEYNYIHDVCRETSDAGAVYTGRRWDWGSNEIRYNYICNVIDVVRGGAPNGIYLDDAMALQYVHGNILVNIGGVGITGGGNKLQKIENNVLCNVQTVPIYNNDNGINWSHEHTMLSGDIWANIREFYLTDIWRYAYPGLLVTVETNEPRNWDEWPDMDESGVPVYNAYNGNVIFGCGNDIDSWKHHEYANGVQMGVNERMNATVMNNTEYTEKDVPDVFVDPDNGNFFLKEDSRVYRDIIGFEKWDYSLIGPQK